ncbi:MAG TPA: c-type cytochrome domain-containing protein [Puia sp.]|nr:c-type cytochrome domain-containing protein [Puia sp.]
MKGLVKRIAENVLFVANSFILFLILFEDRVVLPTWLQSAGRMHPLVLHFPIVILLVAMTLSLLPLRFGEPRDTLYREITSGLWLAGALAAAITVIFGLLLSKEPGYDGDAVVWHKWAGIGVVVIASMAYYFRNKNWYRSTISRALALCGIICIIAAGHLGAGITHGENFISAPMRGTDPEARPSVEKAVIYADLVQPIFKTRCVSCHNAGKTKGGLSLEDTASILKGGRTGKLFIARHADSSLIIERINLPEDEKKHMPLSGKPQLTKDERDLLWYWVQAGGDFRTKFIDLPEDDSLRLVAAKFLGPEEGETYSFAAADEKLIKKLNNNYRVIYPVNRESPALEVDFFNRSQYSSKSLSDLLEIKTQVVDLNLDRMPVTNADLKTIAQFENLRNLNLNFSNITVDGLSQLMPLNNLKRLSLSGTRMNAAALARLAAKPALREMVLWNTGLTGADISVLKQSNRRVRYILGFETESEPPMPLNEPMLVSSKNVFRDTMHIYLKHPVPGVQIRYSIDGSNPDSVNSPLFQKDLVLDRSVTLKARAFKSGWLGSDSIAADFYKSIYRPDTILFLSPPGDAYKASGSAALSDQVIGNTGFTSGKWLGFQHDMELMLEFHKLVSLRSVGLHLLRNSGADIYPPVEIRIWGGRDEHNLSLLQTISPKAMAKGDPASVFLAEGKFSPVSLRYIKIIATSVKKAPKFGAAPGKPGWVFADELLLN